MAAVTDATALAQLGSLTKQKLLDFHKVYLQKELATKQLPPIWDEQYFCVGKKEIFLIKCRYLGDSNFSNPRDPENDSYEDDLPEDDDENAPQIIFRFPYIAIENIVVPTNDNFGFLINIHPPEKITALANKYRLYSDDAFLSVLSDELKDDDPDDEKESRPPSTSLHLPLLFIVNLAKSPSSCGRLLILKVFVVVLLFVQLDLALLLPAHRRLREEEKRKQRTAKIQGVLEEEWGKVPLQLTFMTMLRQPVIQSLRAMYKTDLVMRENSLGDLLMLEDPAMHVSPFGPFDLLASAKALRRQWENEGRDPRWINRLTIESRRAFRRAGYSFLAWDAFHDTADFDHARPSSIYTLPVLDQEALEKRQQHRDAHRPAGFAKGDYVPLGALRSDREREERRMDWVQQLFVKREPDYHNPNSGTSDLAFASSIEYMAATIAADQCNKSYSEALLKLERLKVDPSKLKKDDRYFLLVKEVHKKEVAIVFDQSQYFCYKVHIATADRQIGLIGVRRKYMPPDASRYQDMVFVMIGRKLKFYTEKELLETEGLKDESFDPEEMQEFMLPLERLVDSLVPDETHPDAAHTAGVYSHYRSLVFKIQSIDAAKVALHKSLHELNNKKSELEKFLAKKIEEHPIHVKSIVDDAKTEKSKIVDKIALVRKELQRLETGKENQLTEYYAELDQVLDEVQGLQYAWSDTRIYREWRRQLEQKNSGASRKPYYSVRPELLERRRYKPVLVTPYDFGLVVARLNALNADMGMFAWCRAVGFHPTHRLLGRDEDEDEKRVNDHQLEEELRAVNRGVPPDITPVEEFVHCQPDKQVEELKPWDPSQPIQSQTEQEQQIFRGKMTRYVVFRRNLREQSEQSFDRIPSRSLHQWGVRFARAALNCVRPLCTTKIDPNTLEVTEMKPNEVALFEMRMNEMWHPLEEWTKCMNAICDTYQVRPDTPEFDMWSQRLALYFTEVMQTGVVFEFPGRPKVTVTLNDLLTKPVPRYQDASPSKHELEKEYTREKVLELLMRPHVLPVRLTERERAMRLPFWWWRDDVQHRMAHPYEQTGSIYLKLLEFWAISNKMTVLEKDARQQENEELKVDLIPEPRFVVYPRLSLNEAMVIKLLDSNYLRWDIQFSHAESLKKPGGVLISHEALVGIKPDGLSRHAKKMLEEKPWENFTWKTQQSSDSTEKKKLFVEMLRKLENSTKYGKLEGDVNRIWTESVVDLQFGDLMSSISERGKTIPPFLTSLLIERNYNKPLVLSVCNWICRTSRFGIPNELPFEFINGVQYPRPIRGYFEMDMRSVYLALMQLCMRSGPVIVAAAYRALTAIASDPEQMIFHDLWATNSHFVWQSGLPPVEERKGPGVDYHKLNKPFLLQTMAYISEPNTNPLVIASACNFASLLVNSRDPVKHSITLPDGSPPNSFYDFIIERIERDGKEKDVIDDLLRALNRLLLPVMHGERHDSKLLANVCRFIKRLAGDNRIRPRMLPYGFVGSLAELLFGWNKYFNAMEQCLGALTNLLYKLPDEAVNQVMDEKWDAPPNERAEADDEDNESAQLANSVLSEAIKQFKQQVGGGESDSGVSAKDKQRSREEAKRKKTQEDERRRQEAKKREAMLERLKNVPVKKHELRNVFQGLCLVLSRSAMRIHRENALLAVRNATFREEEKDDKEKSPTLHPSMAFLLRNCELETILNQLYSGYAAVESDLDIKWEEAEHFATTMRDKTKVVEPPARTRAREMDLIRLLFARIKDFKALWLKIKKTPWQL